jgi:membrane-associated phospholipid phosphatase
LALIVAWYGWNVLWLRWPLLLLNATVIISSPVQGGHHMVDLLGSFPVTALALYIAALGETKESSAKSAETVNKKQRYKTREVPQGLLDAPPIQH